MEQRIWDLECVVRQSMCCRSVGRGKEFFRVLGKRGVGVVVVFRSSYDPASLAHLFSGVEEKEG